MPSIARISFSICRPSCFSVAREIPSPLIANEIVCLTVDYQTKDDGTLTLRYRDSMEQIRVPRTEAAEAIRKAIKEYRRT